MCEFLVWVIAFDLRVLGLRPHRAVGAEPLGFVQDLPAVQAVTLRIETGGKRAQPPACIHVFHMTNRFSVYLESGYFLRSDAIKKGAICVPWNKRRRWQANLARRGTSSRPAFLFSFPCLLFLLLSSFPSHRSRSRFEQANKNRPGTSVGTFLLLRFGALSLR